MHVLEKLIAYGALPISVSGNFEYNGATTSSKMLCLYSFILARMKICALLLHKFSSLYIDHH